MGADISRVALEQSMLLGGLADDVLDELVAAGRLRRYERGTAVVTVGDPGGDLLVVAAGRIKVLTRSPDGADVVLATAAVGDTLGELSLLDRGPRAATVEAAEPSAVLWLPGRVVLGVVRRHPELVDELLRQQAATIRRMSGMVADLVFLDLPRRVAKYVVENVDPHGHSLLGMSQSDVAAAVGGVRQSVNGALRGLERRGWIRIDVRGVTVRDQSALAEFAGATA